jgi:hypothetical protein
VSYLEQETDHWIKESAETAKPLDADQARQRALEQMCRVIFNLNEFMYTD